MLIANDLAHAVEGAHGEVVDPVATAKEGWPYGGFGDVGGLGGGGGDRSSLRGR